MAFKVRPAEPPQQPQPPLTQQQQPQQKQQKQQKKKKKPIPKAMREQIWIREYGKVFEAKCKTTWCQNSINAWDFQAGHDIPESKGGKTEPGNLVPICARCNLSMADNYTFKEWNAMAAVAPVAPPGKWCCF